MLSAGFDVNDVNGDTVHFGRRVLDYLDKDPDKEVRKRFVLWAANTVKTGDIIPLDDRRIYWKTYNYVDGEEKGMVAIVDRGTLEVFNFYRRTRPPKEFR